jgi:hypothetical protein
MSKYDVKIVDIKRGEGIKMSPGAKGCFQMDLIIGKNDDLLKLDI